MGISRTFEFESGWSLRMTVENHEMLLTARRNDREFTLSSQDSFALSSPGVAGGGSFFLLGERIGVSETPDSITLHSCPSRADGTPMSMLMAHYRLEKAGENAVRITTWFGNHDPIQIHSLDWMALRMDKGRVERCVGFDPDKTYAVNALTHRVHFSAAAVTRADGYVMLSHCGEVDWIPNIGTYENRTEQCLLAVRPGRLSGHDLRTLDEAHPLSAVLSFGEGEPALPEAEPLILPAPRVPQGTRHTLTSGRLSAAIRARAHGASILGICLDDFAIAEGASLLPLTRLEIQNLETGQTQMLTSEFGWERVRVRENKRSLHIDLEKPRGIDLSVSIEARAVNGDAIEWRVDVINSSPEYTVLSASYPPVCFEGGGKVTLFKSEHSGALEKDAYRREERWAGHYASGFSGTMPVFGVYNPDKKKSSGLYAAVHAPAAARLEMRCAFFRRGQGYFDYVYAAEKLGLAANAFRLNGALVVRALDGDWYDMAEIYADYVHGHAEWCPPVGREDSPAWMRDVPMYIMDWMPNDNPDADPVPISIRPPVEPPRDNWYKKPIELARRLGLPIGYHLYNWHFIPFNNDFPFYFPVKEGLEEGVLEMNRHGIHVMPYINGRIADTRDTRGETVRFDKYFRKEAIKNPDGSLSIETYASHEPDGSLCRLAAMCPTGREWRNVLAETVRRLFEEYHMSAVYIDQVAAAGISLCCDPSHGHPVGNGRWWPRAYRSLMARLRQACPEGCGFTTESNAECFADQFDGYLTWAWVTPNLVPFFCKVYAGRIAMLGRNTNGYKKADKQYCRYHIGQAVMFGQQIGWINADVVDDADKIDYLERMCRARWDAKRYYSEGEMLRPPVITEGNAVFVSDASMGCDALAEADVVLASGWRLPGEGRTLIALTNTGDEEAAVTARYDSEAYGAGAIDSVRNYGECQLIELGGGLLKAHLGARSCLMIEAKAQ